MYLVNYFIIYYISLLNIPPLQYYTYRDIGTWLLRLIRIFSLRNIRINTYYIYIHIYPALPNYFDLQKGRTRRPYYLVGVRYLKLPPGFGFLG